jgi:arsenate reductase
MGFVVYHNPDCGTSRNVLAALGAASIESEIVEYLKTPPDRSTLWQLISRMALPVRAVVRERGTPFHEPGLDDPSRSDEEIIDVMVQHPILINRPIVVAPNAVALCRPSDVVLDILPGRLRSNLRKEDGAGFLRDEPTSGDDADLRAALSDAQLPVDDLCEPGRRLFRYRTLEDTTVGFGGYELYGSNALLRLIVVLPAARSARVGRNLVPLLMRRAFDAGARRAFVLTTTAKEFFERLGFEPISRESAPATVLATRQAVGLCPATAPLLARRLAL